MHYQVFTYFSFSIKDEQQMGFQQMGLKGHFSVVTNASSHRSAHLSPIGI